MTKKCMCERKTPPSTISVLSQQLRRTCKTPNYRKTLVSVIHHISSPTIDVNVARAEVRGGVVEREGCCGCGKVFGSRSTVNGLTATRIRRPGPGGQRRTFIFPSPCPSGGSANFGSQDANHGRWIQSRLGPLFSARRKSTTAFSKPRF